MKFFVVLGFYTLVMSANAGPSMHNPFFCYSTDPIRSMTNMGATTTSYEAIRRFNFTTVNPYISRRESARLPLESGMAPILDFAESSVPSDIVSNYEAGRTTLCRPDFEAIRDFTIESDFAYNFTMANASMVTESGAVAMQNIARRFQQTFPNILTDIYSPDRFHFRHTNTARTNTTIRAIASGLFGEVGSQNVIYEDIPDSDWFLRPLDFCPLFNEETSDSNLQRIAFNKVPRLMK